MGLSRSAGRHPTRRGKGGTVTHDAELVAEQAHVDRAYARIDELREAADAGAREASQWSGGPPGGALDREAMFGFHVARRNQLNIGDRSICFGRLDTVAAESFHIGRLAVSDAAGDPLLVDWRAPLASAFYRATPIDPHGMSRRRHIRMRGRDVVAIDDEALDADAFTATEFDLVGEGALLAALAAPRRGQMSDIVATIQAQQDHAIRAPLKGVLVVQGGPGTGKTAVALHRAAYLLYAHPLQLEQQGVLVVGPNKVFAHYVENVLPGLGETGVGLATPAELVTDELPDAIDPAAVARIKGDASMADLLARTLRAHARPLDDAVQVGHRRWRLPLTIEESEAIVTAARDAGGTWSDGRVRAFTLLLDHLTTEAEKAAERSVLRHQLSPVAFKRRVARDELRDNRSVRAIINQLWPRITPDALVDEVLEELGYEARAERSEHDLALIDEATALIGTISTKRGRKAEPPKIDSALERTLSEMGLLPSCPTCSIELSVEGTKWRCDECWQRFKWTEVMIDAMHKQLLDVIERVSGTFKESETVERASTYGHVLVDEAQNLTPMQWRTLRRRCPGGSFTIVGDLNQAGGAAEVHDWEYIAEQASPGHPVTTLELDVNYRTPKEIMDLAVEVLAASEPHVKHPRSVRSTDRLPEAVPADDVQATARAIAEASAAEMAAGSIALIRPTEDAPAISPGAIDQRIVQIGLDDARGLEFDHVIVCEPADFSASDLYVALTRATARLTLVHAKPLPAPIEAWFGRG